MHDATDHLPPSEVRARAVRGAASNLTAHAVAQTLRFGVAVYLARTIAPDDFGLVALVTALCALSNLLRDQGLSNVLVQTPALSRGHIQAVFLAFLLLTVLQALALAGAAPLMVRFYGRPELFTLTLGIAVGGIFSSLAALPVALLHRQLRFNRLALLHAGSLLLAMPAVLYAATEGWGRWALVLYTVLPPGLMLLGAWPACGWRPGGAAAWPELKRLAPAGRRFMSVDVLGFWSQTADALVLGRLVSASALGLYQRAQTARQMLASFSDYALAPVSTSGLSRLQGQPVAFLKAFHTGAYAMALLLAPAGILLVLAPGECLGYVFGPQWLPAAPIMRLIALLFFLHPLARSIHAALFALGQPQVLLQWLALAACLTLLAIWLGSRYAGLPGVAAGVVLAQFLALPVGLSALAARMRVSPARLAAPLAPVYLAAGLIAAAAWPFARRAGPITVTAWPRLAIAGAACGLFALAALIHLIRSNTGRRLLGALAPSLPAPVRGWAASRSASRHEH